MQNLLNAEQMHSADAFTIKKQGITSIELMEAAATAFVKVFTGEIDDQDTSIAILCGKGNNGADGLAIARILRDTGYTNIMVYLIAFSARETEEYKANLDQLKELWFPVTTIKSPAELPELKDAVIIDAILGSGLNKELTGPYLELCQLVNNQNLRVIAVDVPTGFPSEGPIKKDSVFLKACLVICFQRPKINFFFPESVLALSAFKVADIGLDEEYIQGCDSAYQLIDAAAIQEFIKPRKSFTHKGTYGHALIVAGQSLTMGAALLAAKACLHTGAGLTTVSIPESGLTALNAALPEVMYLDRQSLHTPDQLKKFQAIAVGPGLGTNEQSVKVLHNLMSAGMPLVIDADGLNILGNDAKLMSLLSPGSVLTPHMKEFDRLFGAHDSWWDRLQKAREIAVSKKCIILLKNQYTFIIDQNGNVTINSTGNPAMAQGGMGDVLTGLITAFIAQGLDTLKAVQTACYLHGKSGDELAEAQGTVTGSQLAGQLPATLKGLIK